MRYGVGTPRSVLTTSSVIVMPSGSAWLRPMTPDVISVPSSSRCAVGGADAVSPRRCTIIGTWMRYSNVLGAKSGTSLPAEGTSAAKSGEQPVAPSPVKPGGHSLHTREPFADVHFVIGSQPPLST